MKNVLEGFHPQLTALLHGGIDFPTGEAVQKCLVFCLVQHIGLLGQESVIKLQCLLEAGKASAQDAVNGHR